MADFFAKIDTTIMGRKTASGWVKNARAWRDARNAGHGQLRSFPAMEAGKREGFEVVNGSLTTLWRKLKRRRGKDIYLGGGGELARSFLQEDLVDELFIGLGPYC